MKTLLKVVFTMLDQEGQGQRPVKAAETMLICHCERVNDRRIREAVENGARTVGQVGKACGAGTCCGGCVKAIAELVEEAEARPHLAVSDQVRRLPAAEASPRAGRPLPIAAE